MPAPLERHPGVLIEILDGVGAVFLAFDRADECVDDDELRSHGLRAFLRSFAPPASVSSGGHGLNMFT